MTSHLVCASSWITLGLLCVAVPAAAAPIECRLLSLSPSGSLAWTCNQTNVHAGFQYTTSLGDPWNPAPGGYWNFVVTNYSSTSQLPPEAMTDAKLFLRMAASSNDLGSGFSVYSVPQRTLVVDGTFADWAAISPAITDSSGDGSGLAGSDITALYIARDSTNIYFRLDLASGPPSPLLYYGVDFHLDSEVGDRFVFIQMSVPSCTVDEWDSGVWFHFPVATGQIAVNQNQIEFSVPASPLNLPIPSIVHAWNDATGPSIDSTSRFEAIWP